MYEVSIRRLVKFLRLKTLNMTPRLQNIIQNNSTG